MLVFFRDSINILFLFGKFGGEKEMVKVNKIRVTLSAAVAKIFIIIVEYTKEKVGQKSNGA